MEENNSKNKKVNNSSKKSIIIVAIVIAFIFSNIMFFYIGNVFAFSGLTLKNVSEDVAKDLGDIKDVKKYNLLFQVRAALLAKYDGQIDDDALLEAAI
ncbi:peptidase S41, partial [Clostridium perfringens]|nr:peptidase S41 [Clostridium perfringens]